MGRFMIRILVLLLAILTIPAMAQDTVVTFKPITAAIMNPDRGWWRFAVGSTDFLNASQADLDDFRDSGLLVNFIKQIINFILRHSFS